MEWKKYLLGVIYQRIQGVIYKVVSDSLQSHGLQPWDLLSMGFSRQEYQSGLPFPSPGDLPNPGIEPRSPTLQADTLPSEPAGRSYTKNLYNFFVLAKKQAIQFKKSVKDMNKHFSKEKLIQMVNRYMKRYLISLIVENYKSKSL